MKLFNEVIKLQDLVKRLLEDYPQYRDSDHKLVARVWTMQLGGNDRIKRLSVYDFLCSYVQGEVLASHESISRARRKVQQDYTHLKSTDDKTAKEKNFRNNINKI